MARKRQKAGKSTVRAADRRRKALDLRIAGHTFEVIGKRLKVGKTRAYQLVMEALDEAAKETADKAAELRELELARLEGIIAKLWPKRNTPRAADSLERLIRARARLLGLEAAEKKDVTHHGDALTRLSALLARRLDADAEGGVPGQPDAE
jgi:hypothetical protein